MNLTPPRPSLPPPQLPAKLVAESRIRALQAELGQATDAAVRSALAYEIASLTEHRLGDRNGALALYRQAHEWTPTFRPALAALIAAAEAQDDDATLLPLLEAQIAAARTPSERASALVDKAVWLGRASDNSAECAQLLADALDVDPKCQIAALLLERHHYAVGDATAAERIAEARSSVAHDPALKSALLVEVAQARERDRDPRGAIQILRGAAGLPQGRWHALEAMERVARAHGDAFALVEALEGRAVLAAMAARDERNRVTINPRSVRRFRNAEHALQHSAALWRQAARVRAFGCDDPISAASAYDQALSVFPDSVLLHQEKMFACELADDYAGAAAQAQILLKRQDLGPYASSLHFHVAEQAQRTEDMDGARAALESALLSDPNSPAAAALFDDWQLDNDEVPALIERLHTAARERHDPDALLRAIDLAANVTMDLQRAAAIAERAVDGDHRGIMWRLLLAAAFRDNDAALLLHAAEQLCVLGVSDSEHSVLMRERHYVLRHHVGDGERADALLRAALDDARCRDWAPDCARLMALTQHNLPLLSAAHRALAEYAPDDELRAAHQCAGARACIRAGDEHGAVVLLREALDRDPTNPYAVSLLEELLLRRGEANEAVALLRATAEAQANTKRSELALLHAGVAAEIAGDLRLAARSYEESADKDPDALAPLWSLRQLAERTRDDTVLLTALEGLAAREQRLGNVGVATLEVGEHYDVMGKAELALEPLVAALSDRSAASAAALSLVTLPRVGGDVQHRERALTHLQHHMPDGIDRASLRGRIALHATTQSEHRTELIADLLAWDPSDRVAHLETVAGADEIASHATALLGLAGVTDDRGAAGQLLLDSLQLDPSPDTAIGIADRIAELLPDSLQAAIAREHALRAQPHDIMEQGDADPEALAYAMLARAELSSIDLAPQQRAAVARLLMQAERTTEAAALARSVLAREPDDLATWELLRAACHLLEDWSGVVEACDALSPHCEGEVRAQLLEESASVLMDQLGRPHDAEQRLREALSIDPTRVVAFDRLHDLLADRHDEPALVELIRRRIDVTDEPDELADLFYEQARLHRSAGDRQGALAWIDSLLMMDEHHLGGLGLAAEVHVSMEQWALATDSLKRLARADGVPATQKRLSHIAAADFLERRLGDLPGAHRELADLAASGLADATLYTRMAALALRIGNVEDAVQAYAAAAQLAGGPERATHERMAGHLLRERIGDRARAAAAYRRALEAQPDDLDACAQLLALEQPESERQQALTAFEAAVRASMLSDPTWASPWQKLKQVALWSGNRDLHYLVLSAMGALGVDDSVDPEERERLEARRPAQPSGRLDETQLSLMRARYDTRPWADLGVYVAETIANLQRIEPATYGVERKHRVGKRDPQPVRDALLQLLQVFGLDIDHFYLGHRDAKAIDVVPADKVEHDWIVGAQVAVPLSDRDKFRVAQRAMSIRTQAFPLLPCPREEAVDLLYGVSAAAEAPFAGVALTDVPLDDAARAMPRRARKGTSQLTPTLDARDAERYVDAANQTAARAGLLLTGNLRLALDAVLGDGYTLDAVSGNDSARELVLFAVSPELLALRRRIGVAL